MLVSQVLEVLLIVVLGAFLHELGFLISALAVMILYSFRWDYNFHLDSSFSWLFLLSACVLAWRARAPSYLRSAVLACCLGATLLCRSTLFAFPALLALFEWAVVHRRSLRSSWKHSLILCLVPYLFLIPWIAMNWTIHQRFIPFEDGAANHNMISGVLGLVENIEGDLRTLVDEPLDVRDGGAVLRWSVRELLRHPVRYAASCLQRIWFVVCLHPLVVLFAAVSLWIYRGRRDFQQLGLLAAYFVLIHSFMSVEERYFFPLWPLMAVLAGALVVGLRPRALAQENALEYRFSQGVMKGAVGVALAFCLYTHWVVLSYAGAVRLKAPGPESDIDAALAKHPRDAWLLSERGKRQLERGEIAAAEKDLAAASALLPEDADLRLKRAWARALLGKPAELLDWRPPPFFGSENLRLKTDGQLFKGFALLRLGREREAQEHLKSAAQAYAAQNIVVPGADTELERRTLERLRASDAGFLERCFSLFGKRSPEETRLLNAALSKILPETSGLWLERAVGEAAAGNRAASLKSLARAEALGPSDQQRRRLALLYRRLNELSRAAAVLEPVLSRSRAPGLWIESGELAAAAGDRAAALKSLAKAEALGPADEEWRAIAGLYRGLGAYDQASVVLEALGKRRPKDTGLWLEQAAVAGILKKNDLARKFLARAEALEPGEGDLRRIAYAYQGLAAYDRALAILERLSRRRPEQGDLYADMGLCKYLNGSAEGAVQDLLTAIKLDPKLFSAYLSLGAIYTAQGRREEAKSLYDRALSKAPKTTADPLVGALRRERAAL